MTVEVWIAGWVITFIAANIGFGYMKVGSDWQEKAMLASLSVVASTLWFLLIPLGLFCLMGYLIYRWSENYREKMDFIKEHNDKADR